MPLVLLRVLFFSANESLLFMDALTQTFFSEITYVNEKVGVVKRHRKVVLYFLVYKLYVYCQGICRDVITVLINLV